jgi:hypothetical protein
MTKAGNVKLYQTSDQVLVSKSSDFGIKIQILEKIVNLNKKSLFY